jgi:hypothetical protein
MVEEVFSGHFDVALKAFQAIRPDSSFSVQGEVFADELVIGISLISQGHLAATTVYASADFDPKASSPTIQDLLSACVDAAGGVFSTLMDADRPETLAQLAEEFLSELEGIPLEWTSLDSNQRRVFVKVDKANLVLEKITDDWLKKNDPHYEDELAEEQAETAKLFVTGPSSASPTFTIKNTQKNKVKIK